jgi:hypothetical protein
VADERPAVAGASRLRLTKVPEQNAPVYPLWVHGSCVMGDCRDGRAGQPGWRGGLAQVAGEGLLVGLASLPRPYADVIVTNSGFIRLSAGWAGNRVSARNGVVSLTRILS